MNKSHKRYLTLVFALGLLPVALLAWSDFSTSTMDGPENIATGQRARYTLNLTNTGTTAEDHFYLAQLPDRAVYVGHSPGSFPVLDDAGRVYGIGTHLNAFTGTTAITLAVQYPQAGTNTLYGTNFAPDPPQNEAWVTFDGVLAISTTVSGQTVAVSQAAIPTTTNRIEGAWIAQGKYKAGDPVTATLIITPLTDIPEATIWIHRPISLTYRVGQAGIMAKVDTVHLIETDYVDIRYQAWYSYTALTEPVSLTIAGTFSHTCRLSADIYSGTLYMTSIPLTLTQPAHTLYLPLAQKGDVQ